MKKYIPSIYKKSVFDVNYDKVYDGGVRHLMFDLDNTLTWAKSSEISDEIAELIEELKKKFTVDLVSNSRNKRVSTIAKRLNVDYVSFARKPSIKSFNIIQNKYDCSRDAIAIIGDQLFTDVKGGNTFGVMTILVDPIGDDIFVTYYNRWRENRKLKKLAKAGNLERGKYYE